MATVQVRMSEQTKKTFDQLAIEVNKQRKKNGLLELATAGFMHEAVRLLVKDKERLGRE